jgi:hypothetical protein
VSLTLQRNRNNEVEPIWSASRVPGGSFPREAHHESQPGWILQFGRLDGEAVLRTTWLGDRDVRSADVFDRGLTSFEEAEGKTLQWEVLDEGSHFVEAADLLNHKIRPYSDEKL